MEENISKIYFLGIGGIGMSSLARYYRSRGAEVHGYDKTPTELTSELISEGMFIHFEDDPGLIPADTAMVIYTPAVPPDLNEFRFCAGSDIPMYKRSEALGHITRDRFTIAVAGTHGKTSISAMIAHIMKNAGYSVTALIGGISKNYSTNYITSGSGEYMVVEADEYDRSFLQLHPDIAVISSVDADHLDIYSTGEEVAKSFQQFAQQIKTRGKLIIRNDISLELDPTVRRIDFAMEEAADIFAINIRVAGGTHYFDMITCEHQCRKISLEVPGRHNILNALAATAVCRNIGIERETIMEGLRTFKGVRRRFDIRIAGPEYFYIDDYAHHPRELDAFIRAVKELHTGKRITGVFQPHLYSRTRDFAEGFAESLELLDEIYLLDIYPAREKEIPGITSAIILDRIHKNNKWLVSREELLKRISEERPEVLVTMGAGDIDQLVGPIEKIYKER